MLLHDKFFSTLRLFALFYMLISPAKATLSAKGIGFSEKDVGDIFRKKINRDAGTEKTTWPPQLEEADSTEINPLEADVP